MHSIEQLWLRGLFAGCQFPSIFPYFQNQTNYSSIISIFLIAGRVLTCYCEGQCPETANIGECETRAGGFCFSSVSEIFDETSGSHVLERTYGCMPPEHSGGLLQVRLLRTEAMPTHSNFKLSFHLIFSAVQSLESTPSVRQEYYVLWLGPLL